MCARAGVNMQMLMQVQLRVPSTIPMYIAMHMLSCETSLGKRSTDHGSGGQEDRVEVEGRDVCLGDRKSVV